MVTLDAPGHGPVESQGCRQGVLHCGYRCLWSSQALVYSLAAAERSRGHECGCLMAFIWRKTAPTFMPKDREVKHVVQIMWKDVSECLHRCDKIWMKICRGCETSELVSPWITPWVYLGLDQGRLVQCSYGSPKEWVSAILETSCVYDAIFENIWGKGELELP